MANELKIKSSIDLNTTKAFEQLSKFKSDAEQLKAIDIKVNIQGLNKVESELRGLLELSNKISKDKIGLSIKQPSVDTSSTKKELEYLKKYKDTYKAIEKLKQQKAKGVSDDSLKRINSDIEKLQGNLDKYKSKIQDVNKIKLFEESQDLSSFVKAEQSITNVINKAEKLQKSFSGIEFKNVDSSKLEGDISKTVSKIEELQTKAKQDINIDIDLNNAINDLNRLDGELKNLKELDAIKGNFESLESSMKDAFGTEYVEKLRGEIEQLEGSVKNLDGAFDRSASSVKGMLSTASSDMRRMNSEMRNSGRFMNDFKGSFAAFTAGNVIGDGIVRGIREVKDAFLEMDAAMTNIKKVADPGDISSTQKLDDIRSKAIATAKDVGQSSAEVMNAIADTLQAGIGNMQTSMDVAKQTMMLANVGELDQSTASSAVNTMIKGFKIDPVVKYKQELNGVTREVTQLEDSMDMLNHASNQYGTSAQQLVDGLQNGATVLGAYGVSVGDTIGMMTAGIEVLGNGNKVGNGLKSIGINLNGIKANAKDGTLELNKTAKALQEVAGVDVYSDKKNGQLKTMTQILDEVYQKWETFNDEQKAGLSEAIAGKQQASVFQALMQNFETYKKVRDDFANGSHFGSMTAENEQYVDSISGKLNKLKETWISIGTTIVSSDFTKGILDGVIAISEAIDNVIKAADKIHMLTPTLTGIGLTFAQMFKNSTSGSMFASVTRDVNSATQGMTLFQRASSGVGGVFKNAGSMALTFGKSLLKNVGIMSAVTLGIKAISWGYNELTGRVKRTGEALKEVEDAQLNEISGNKDKLNSLETIGRQYEELSNKANKSAEDQAKLVELGNELAKVMPEIQIGTDSDGNAIISMTNDMEGYISKTKEAIAQQERLLLGTRLDESDNALKMMTKGEIIGKGLNEQKIDVQEDYNKRMVDLEKHYSQAMLNVQNSHGEKQKKHMQEARKIKEDMIKAESEYGNKYAEVQAQVMTQAGKHRNTMESLWKTSASMLVNDLIPEVENGIQAFTNSMDFTQIDSDAELDSVKRIFREIPKMAQEGKVNIEQLNTQISDINSEFAKTGNIKDYNMNMRKLAESVSAQTGWDASVLTEMFTTISDGTLKSSHSLDNFLSKFNKTTQDIQNGDKLAKALQGQYQAIEDYINQINNADLGDTEMNAKIRVNLQTDKNLPKQVRDMVTNMSNLGVDDSVIIPITAEVLMALKDGGISKDEMVILKQRIDQQMNDSLGKDYTAEMKMQVHGYLDKLNTKDIQKDIEGELKNAPTEKEIEVKYNTTGEEELKSADEYLKTLEGRPDVYKEVKTVVQGKEELALYGEIIEKLPVNQEFTNKFIVDNKQALSGMKSYQEVLDFINKQPKSFKTTYGFNVENADKVEQAIDNIDAKTKDEKQLSIKTNEGEILDSIKDVETLIDLSAKVEDGKYKLDIEANTQGAVENINNFKNAINELSNQFRNSPITTIKFNAETAQGAQNITGLKTRIEEFKALSGTVKTVKFNTDTATASKNVTGLKNNVSSYVKSYCGKSFSTKFNCQTALASQNVSGLRRNVSSYVASYGGKTFTTTFKVVTNKVTNVSTVNTGGGKGGKSASGKSVQATSTQSVQVASASVQPTSSGIASIQSTPSATPSITRSAIPRVTQPTRGVQALAQDLSRGTMKMTNFTPIAIGGGDIADGLEFSIDLLKELDSQLKIVTNQIDLLNKKSELATGKEKINYLKEQNSLYKEQQEILAKREEYLGRQKNYYEYSLKNRGVTFNSDGNMTNYEELLIKKEKEVKALEQKANKEKASDSDKKKYESAKSALDDFKKYADEYYKVTFDELPKVQGEWQQLENDIRKNAEAVKNLEREQKLYTKNTKLKEIAEFQDELADKQDIINEKMKHASGEEQVKYHKQLIGLSETYLKHQNLKIKTYKESLAIMQEEMKEFGFTFDANGSMENIDEVLNKLQDSKDLEYVNKLMEEYVAIQRDKLPEAQKEWEKLNNEIIDSQNAVKELNKELSQLKFETAFTSAQKHVDELNNALEMLDVRLENAFGENKSELLQEKVDLLHKQKQEMLDVINILNKSKNDLKGQLTDKGFNIDEKGNIRNYDSHMAKLKNTLPKEEFAEIEKLTKSYLDLLVKEIPQAEREWENMNNEIIKHQNELEKVLRQIKLDVYVNKLKDLENEYDRLADKLDIVDAKLKYAHGVDKVALLEKQRELLEEQMKLQDDVTKQYESMMKIYQTDLSEFGVKFNEDGDILNLDSILNKYQGHQDIEKLKELIDEYLEIQRDKLPDAEKKWEDLNNAIKDSYKEQLQLTKDVEDKITEVYKKQVEERKKLIDKELDHRLKALKKEQDAYNKQREEHKYNTNYQDQMDKVKELEKQLEVAKKDDSIMGKKRVEELLKQLKEEQKKLEDMVQDKIDSDINNMYDEESDRLQEEADKAKEDLDEKYSDDKLQQIVKDSLSNGIFVDIDGNIKDLQDTLLEFEDKFGDGMTAVGAIIKSELIANLETAKETVKDMSSILDDMDLSEFKTQGYSVENVGRSVTPEVASTSNTIQFNSPIVNIEGNVDNNVVDELKKVSRDIENNVVKKIVKARR